MKIDLKVDNVFFCFHRRSYSLDIEVSASGFTKDLERDGALLHPAGPDGEEEEEEEDGDEDEELDKHSREEKGEKEDEESLDIEEYKHAILELEGLKVSDSHTHTQDEDKESEGDEEEPGIAPTGSDDEADNGHDEELKEAEDECPELFDLSTSNKDFKPFRYGNSYLYYYIFLPIPTIIQLLLTQAHRLSYMICLLQRLKQPSARSRTQEDADRQ